MTPDKGQGPGHITPDGCSVEVYTLLRAGPEPELISSAVPAGASILELGAGAGRVTRELVARGYRMTAVDESAEMLAHVENAETVVARIEGLDLGRRFDAVLLCSHFINTPDPLQRDELVGTCARHVADGGCVVIERHSPAWFETAADTAAVMDGLEVRLRDVSRPGDGVVAATVEYEYGGQVWAQSFTAQRVDDEVLASTLERHGLVIDRHLDEAGGWVTAVRHGDPMTPE